MDGFERITGREHEELVEKCQENGWLKVGGFDWQDDPFLEEYPYEFSRTDSVDRLREALGSGNWAIRQGFCYRDLAFIQQVNGGDEWWTLKRVGTVFSVLDTRYEDMRPTIVTSNYAPGVLADRLARRRRSSAAAASGPICTRRRPSRWRSAPRPPARRAARTPGRKPARPWRERGPSGPNRDDRGAKAPLFHLDWKGGAGWRATTGTRRAASCSTGC